MPLLFWTYLCWKTAISSLQKYSPDFEKRFTFWYSWLYWKTENKTPWDFARVQQQPESAQTETKVNMKLCDLSFNKIDDKNMTLWLERTNSNQKRRSTHGAGAGRIPHLKSVVVCWLWTWNFDHLPVRVPHAEITWAFVSVPNKGKFQWEGGKKNLQM